MKTPSQEKVLATKSNIINWILVWSVKSEEYFGWSSARLLVRSLTKIGGAGKDEGCSYFRPVTGLAFGYQRPRFGEKPRISQFRLPFRSRVWLLKSKDEVSKILLRHLVTHSAAKSMFGRLRKPMKEFGNRQWIIEVWEDVLLGDLSCVRQPNKTKVTWLRFTWLFGWRLVDRSTAERTGKLRKLAFGKAKEKESSPNSSFWWRDLDNLKIGLWGVGLHNS